ADYNLTGKAGGEVRAEGHKARITVMVRGRENTHREIGQAILTQIGKGLKEIAVIEQPPRLEGRLLFMILAPNPRWLQSMRAQQERKAAQAAQPPRPPKPPQPHPPSAQPAAAPAAPIAAPAQAEAPKA